MKDNVCDTEIPKSKERLEVIKKIEDLERAGQFDIDVENDPPAPTLLPNQIDYSRSKIRNKINRKIAYSVAIKFLKKIMKNGDLIIKEVNGIENFKSLTTGAIITCNHFNPFDCFTVESVLWDYKGKKNIYKVIREGNYTNFPGLYGYLFRHCNTLPLSSNSDTMKKFFKAVNQILNNGEYILIYPEQSMWWNYRKPKPLKAGAYKFAVQNNVPVLPIFITMKDSNKIGIDGFPVQEYIVNIDKPIYPDSNLSQKENIKNIMEKNYEVWKNIYEKFYEKPLEYTCDK